MSVAYQAGALRALIEAGYAFDCADAMSTGSLNLSMLLSGRCPVDMCGRWSSLPPRWLRSAAGMHVRVFPHLGIDVATINRQRSITASYEVARSATRSVTTVVSQDVTVDDLVTCATSPSPVSTYPDLLTGAIERGADDLWILWCPAQRGPRAGEASENLLHACRRIDAINRQIAAGEIVARHTNPIRVHVIRPERPLPPDRDLLRGRTTNATLIDMGYADARRYVRNAVETQTSLEAGAIATTQIRSGLTFRETMSGWFALGQSEPVEGARAGREAGTRLALHATIDIADMERFVNDACHAGKLYGHIAFGDSAPLPASSGAFQLFSPGADPAVKLMIYEAGISRDGCDYYLAGKKLVQNASIFDLWPATTTLYVQLHRGSDAAGPVVGAGVLHLTAANFLRLMLALHATNMDRRRSGLPRSRPVHADVSRATVGHVRAT